MEDSHQYKRLEDPSSEPIPEGVATTAAGVHFVPVADEEQSLNAPPPHVLTEEEDEAEFQKDLVIHPPVRPIILVSVFMFMGYAILVSFQKKLKKQFDIGDDSSDKSRQFSAACSFLYIGNLVFRLAHNFIFACVKPRNRVYVSMGCMTVSMCILGLFVFTLKWTGSLATVFIAYALGGVGIGSFESNLLSSITPLGHETKLWAVIGFPLGFACILIGGFLLSALNVPTAAIYAIVAVGLIVGILIFAFVIPVTNIEHNATNLSDFIDNLKQWRKWFPFLYWHSAALMIDMFMVSLFSSVMLYIYNADDVPLYGPESNTLVNTNWYFVVYNIFTLSGDSLSRKLVYYVHLHHPFWYLICSFVGAAICLTKWAIVAPIGIFFVMFGNGSIYASATRHIDQHVDKQFNLVALSVWLFIGDIGSVIGSNVVSYIDTTVCSTHYDHMCRPGH